MHPHNKYISYMQISFFELNCWNKYIYSGAPVCSTIWICFMVTVKGINKSAWLSDICLKLIDFAGLKCIIKGFCDRSCGSLSSAIATDAPYDLSIWRQFIQGETDLKQTSEPLQPICLSSKDKNNLYSRYLFFIFHPFPQLHIPGNTSFNSSAWWGVSSKWQLLKSLLLLLLLMWRWHQKVCGSVRSAVCSWPAVKSLLLFVR